jgi:anhydro-N-acetylmuramic acid kinase
LLPYLDWVLLSAPGGAPRSIVNIGGMSNVTHLSGDAPPVGFDTGPGNLVINHAARLADPDLPHDVDGRLAASGTVDEALLGRLMSHPYLSRRPPKSTGREELGEGFVHAVTSEPGAATGADLVATLTRWVARSIARALIDFTPRPGEVVVCGGGAHNPVLMAWLSEELGAPLGLTDDFGVPGDAKEAMGFALLGSELMRGQPANVPSVTGAAGPRLLGSITWA